MKNITSLLKSIIFVFCIFLSAYTNSQSLIDFDGIDDYIDFRNSHDYTGSLTIEAWILQENTKSTATIVSKTNSKTNSKSGYSLELINNYPRFTWYKRSGQNVADIISPFPIINNKWYHIAVTYNKNSVQLYIDGVQVKNSNTRSNPNGNSNSFIIGAAYDSDTPTVPKNYFDGYIDEVRIWDVSLSPIQLREMMNQEINQNGSAVKGKIVPRDVSGELLWKDLKGYYTMTDNSAMDRSGNSINGTPMNTTTAQLQNAPLPYTTKSDGDWRDASETTPWLFGNSAWNAPNIIGVDGVTSIDWNIVKISNNISSGNQDITVLALILDKEGKKLSIANPYEEQDENNSGQGLRVTHYLKMDGNIDLVGESQLVQDLGSILEVNSRGKLQKDQQGTRDLFTYNFWSSPVGKSNITTNNNGYKLPDVLRDGTSAGSPLAINFLTSGYNGSSGSPIGIADYWIWKYVNKSGNSYSQWQHVRSTGTLLAGEGYTMKGVINTNGDVSQKQNYVFEGKPNNGDISLTVDPGNNYLIGNPYPSAIDAHQFLLDNKSHNSGNGVITGPLYFWNHWGNGTHAASGYQGGYATYSMSGGTPAPTKGNNSAHANKSPGRYIPVGQGFFVSSQTGTTIKFNNGQRVFKKENGGESIFIRSNDSQENLADVDTRMKIRLGFNSVNTIHRQLLLTIDENTTPDIDWGYDALIYEFQIDDMFWMIKDDKYVIQSTNEINKLTTLPFGIQTSKNGLNRITIDGLENFSTSIKILVHDKALDIRHDLHLNDYEVYLNAGEYLNRFEIVFITKKSFVDEEPGDLEEIVEPNEPVETTESNEIKGTLKLEIHFSNRSKSLIVSNPELENIKSLELFNLLGQTIYSSQKVPNVAHQEININNLSSGAYIIKINYGSEIISKKVLVK